MFIYYVLKVSFLYSLTSVISKNANKYIKKYAIKATLAHIMHWEIKTSLSNLPSETYILLTSYIIGPFQWLLCQKQQIVSQGL